MTIKKDVMPAFLDTASKLCTGNCDDCVTKDERFYDSNLIKHLSRYGLIDDVDCLVKNVCSLGVTVGKEMEEYGRNNPSNYQRLITSTAKNLQKNSIGKVRPEAIRSTFGFLSAYVNLSEQQVIENAKKIVEILTPTSASIIPEAPRVLRMSPSTRKFLGSFDEPSF